MKFWRLLKHLMRMIRIGYGVWQMNEATRDGSELYSCATCGMARTEPCEHWQAMIADSAQGAALHPSVSKHLEGCPGVPCVCYTIRQGKLARSASPTDEKG